MPGTVRSQPLSGQAADGVVPDCFGLGWQVSLLRRHRHEEAASSTPEGTPSEVSAPEGVDLRLERAARLLDSIAASSPERQGTLSLIDDVRRAVAYSAEESAVRRAVSDLDAELLVTLSAVAEPCATAYLLGRALADTCVPAQTVAQMRQHLAAERLGRLIGWLDELGGTLPEHAAGAVGRSLESWGAWADEHLVPATAEPVAWRAAGALERQGGRWHSLLTGERMAADVLLPEDYEDVAGAVLGRTRSVAARAARTFWLPLALVTALFGLGVALVVDPQGGTQVIAGLGAMVLAVAVSWRMAVSLLGPLRDRLQGPIWQAACAGALARRLTVLPEVERAAPDAPPPIRITRRRVLREASTPEPAPHDIGPADTAYGEGPSLLFGPPAPPPGEPNGDPMEEHGTTGRLQAASRSTGRQD